MLVKIILVIFDYDDIEKIQENTNGRITVLKELFNENGVIILYCLMSFQQLKSASTEQKKDEIRTLLFNAEAEYLLLEYLHA